MTAPTILVRASTLADDVRAEARRVDPVKAFLTVLFVVPFVLGWLAATLMRVVWTAVSWTWAAVVVGWRTAYGRVDGGG